MYGVHRLACLIAVTPLLCTNIMAATNAQHFIDSTTTNGAVTVAPVAPWGAKGLFAPAPQIARVWPTAGTGEWQMVPSRHLHWDADNRIPMNQGSANSINHISRIDAVNEMEEGRGKNKYYKKYKKYMLPLLLAYKLKFFTLVPILIGGLVLLTGATGLAGFFFALFAATMGLKNSSDH